MEETVYFKGRKHKDELSKFKFHFINFNNLAILYIFRKFYSKIPQFNHCLLSHPSFPVAGVIHSTRVGMSTTGAKFISKFKQNNVCELRLFCGSSNFNFTCSSKGNISPFWM